MNKQSQVWTWTGKRVSWKYPFCQFWSERERESCENIPLAGLDVDGKAGIVRRSFCRFGCGRERNFDVDRKASLMKWSLLQVWMWTGKWLSWNDPFSRFRCGGEREWRKYSWRHEAPSYWHPFSAEPEKNALIPFCYSHQWRIFTLNVHNLVHYFACCYKKTKEVVNARYLNG